MVNDSSCAYSAVTRAARRVSYGSYSTVSVGAVNDAGKGNWADEESSPLMLIEDDAVVNVLVIYYF